MTKSSNMLMQVSNYLINLQSEICNTLAAEDGGEIFQKDEWQHSGLGAGVSCVLNKGNVFESAGVNYSCVSGKSLPQVASRAHHHLPDAPFTACGVSLVLHPENPFIPTTHANFRFFMAETQPEPTWWFGGGYDLTPYYGFDEDCVHWHQTAKGACDHFDPAIYPEFKRACDEYFYLPHRLEHRGIGGVFFDDFNRWEFERCLGLWQKLGDSFLAAYLPIVKRRKDHGYTDRERAFQLYRRGRYVEFNLLFDRGTKFGIQFGGRTESILMSLPPQVEWRYNWHPEPSTPEKKLYDYYLQPRDWVTLAK